MKSVYLIFLSLIGFFVSFYLYYSKTHNKQLYCPLGHDCDAVVKSKYGAMFGIENTIPGMLFYALIFAYGVSMLFNQNIFKGSLVYYFIVSASVCSVLFSVYLTAVQAFVLKKWCDYCIISSIVSVLILILIL